MDAVTHPYIATGLRDHKFGIDIADAEAVYGRARSLQHLAATGVSCHIGSQLLDNETHVQAAQIMVGLFFVSGLLTLAAIPPALALGSKRETGAVTELDDEFGESELAAEGVGAVPGGRRRRDDSEPGFAI